MKKNDIYVETVSAFGAEGEGIIKYNGYTVFLPFAIPGEKVRFKVLKVQKNIAFAKVEEVLTPADERVRAKCPVFQKCGGCHLMHLAYNSQLLVKRDLIENCFNKIAFTKVKVNKMVASQPEFYYRNKLQLPIRQTDKGVEIGFFALNSHRVVDINNCVIHGEWCEKIITAVRKYVTDKRVSCYNESTHTGLLRHLVVKKVGLNFMVILVVNGTQIPFKNYLINLLKVALEVDYSLFLNVNTREDNVILTNDYIHLLGDLKLSDTILGIKYSIGPESFMQVNDYVKLRLYSKVCEFIQPGEKVIDAYCGAGLLTALLAKKASAVTGIEIVQEAIECANGMAIENQISNVKFICAPCEEVLPEIIEKDPQSVLVLDPPRKGLDKSVALAVERVKPQKIIYVSCAPQTLARDIGIIGGTLKYENNNLIKAVSEPVNISEGELLPNGYKIEKLYGFDMFAQCKGVETLCVLTKEG